MQYYLNSSEKFFEKNYDKRLKFLKDKEFLFSEISKFINNCINNSKEIFLFCAGNSILANHIKSKKINIKEINEKLNQSSVDNIFGCLFLMFSKLFLIFHLEKIIFYHLLIYLIYILVVILK